MRNEDKRQYRESERERKLEERARSKRRRARNRSYTCVSVFFMAIFMGLIAYLIYFNAIKSDDFINSPYNTRQDTFSDRVVRGSILSSDGEVLAQTNVSEDGTEERSYPYGNTFAHVVGYDTNGKSGLESEANFQLLSSHEFFLNQIRNEFMGTKNTGDSVVSTLSADLQTTAYNSLGDRRGAVVALEPSTGKILAMVSKPDFDPNTISENWDSLVNDETNSSLLNRATMGQYPPGSTFKVVTALDYFRTHGSFNGFSFDCQGSITKEGHTIQCYNGNVHGTEDFYTAFANSCNCAFAEIGTELGGASLLKTSEDLLFNKKLPLNSYRKSSFSILGEMHNYVCHGARIALVGWPHGLVTVNQTRLMQKEIDVCPSRNSCGKFPEAIKLMDEGVLPIDKLITKNIKLEDTEATIKDMMENPGDYLKVIIDIK